MALTTLPLRPERPVLSPLSHNPPSSRPVARRTTRATYKPTQPSPLKKTSDYHFIAPLKEVIKDPISSKPSSAGSAPSDPVARVRASEGIAKPAPTGTADGGKTPPKKQRKKILCDTPPAVLRDPKTKNEWNRQKLLGEGGFARCFLIKNRVGDLFAAKTVAKRSLASAKMKKKFWGEISVHQRMIHPNIVRFNECFEDDENVYMILELCPRGSLMDMLKRRKRFTEPEVRFFLLQLLGSLKYMHGKNVIHRDLKLGNIFLDKEMNIKVGDFGLAALLVDENERKMTICGTPNYIAPEVLWGQKEGGHSFEVDLWGVGIIIYAMLVGKPPFASQDIESVYDKIKRNAFTWPSHIPISRQAKDLVESLLTQDPRDRPSLDQVANHAFFLAGLFPKRIPPEAVQVAPTWPSVESLGSTGLAAARQDWRRNYEQCAKLCGVGIDSAGMPIKSTGKEPGRPVPLIPLKEDERPQSAASTTSASGTENECGDLQKMLAKKKEAAVRRAERNKQYILPEALSPRDGHARMRGLGEALKGPVSKLRGRNLFNPVAKAAVDTEEEEETGEEEEEEEEVKEIPRPTRALEKKPIRRSSAEKVEAERKEQEKKAVIAARPTTRSYAAQQRDSVPSTRTTRTSTTAAPVSRTTATTTRPARSSLLKTATTAPTEVEARTEARTEARVSSRTTTTTSSSSSTRSSRQPYTSSDLIPLSPNLTSRIGRPLPSTTTTSLLSSFTPLLQNLSFFLSNSPHLLPPLPASTARAITAHQRGLSNTAVFVSRWVDYTNKYGMAYILTDGTCAALFNDNTSLVVDSVGGRKAEFITQSLAHPDRPDSTETVYRRLSADMEVLTKRAEGSRSLTGKLAVWRRTGNYMTQVLDAASNWTVDRAKAIREPSINHATATVGSDEEDREEGMLWITHYARTRKCVMFRFVDGTWQFNFFDHTKLVLTSGGRTVRCVGKGGEMRVVSLEEAMRATWESREEWAREFGLKVKVGWVRSLVEQWRKGGVFPRGVDGEGREALVLGEGRVAGEGEKK